MKKLITIISTLCMCLCLGMSLTACDFLFQEPEHTHAYTETIATEDYLKSEATCLSKAVYYYSCSCGEYGDDTFEYGEIAEHLLSDWKDEIPATNDESGIKGHYTCNVCNGFFDIEGNEIDSLEIPMLSHVCVYGEKVATENYIFELANCTQPAKYNYSCKCGNSGTEVFDFGEALGHDYGDYISNSDGTHICVCSRNELHIMKNNCHGGQATCTVKAICTDCNEEYGELKQHYFDRMREDVKYLKQAATCDTKAVYFKSCLCGEKGETTFTHGNVLGCDFGDWYSNKNGSHTRVCSRNINHIETANCVGGNATCVNLAICEECDAPYGVLSSEHAYGDYISDKNVTCEKNGTKTACCIYGCGNKRTAVEYALGHSWESEKCERCKIDYFSSGLKYTLSSDSSYYIVAGVGSCRDENIAIPSNYNNKPVKEIKVDAFKNCTTLISVKVPLSVEVIGKGAFYGCNNLTNLTLPFIGLSKSAWQENSGFGAIFGWEKTTALSEAGYLKTVNGKYEYYHYYVPDSLNSVEILTADYIPWCAFMNCKKLDEIIIPDGVTSISSYAFYHCASLKEIDLPDSITSIGMQAFENTGLRNINLPDNLKDIAKYAFTGCDYLNEIVLPDSVQKLGDEVFAVSSISKVSIGSGLKNIGIRVFGQCRNLTEIVVSENNEYFVSDSGILYSKNLVTLYKYPSNKKDESFKFYEETTIIDDFAFDHCINLKEIKFSSELMGIRQNAFEYCTELAGDLVIPDSIATIEEYAFLGCSKLQSLTISNSTYIDGIELGERAFAGCSSLKSVYVGNQFKKIGEGAFSSCSSIERMTLPFVGETRDSSTSQIHFGYIFGASSSTTQKNNVPKTLKKIVINGGKSIGSSAFKDVMVEDLTLPYVGTSLNASGQFAVFGYIFGWTGGKGVAQPNGTTHQYTDEDGCNYWYYIPDTLKFVTILSGRISDNAFYNCKNIREVILRENVNRIGINAFYGCDNLIGLHFYKPENWKKCATSNGVGSSVDVSESNAAARLLKQNVNYYFYRDITMD